MSAAELFSNAAVTIATTPVLESSRPIEPLQEMGRGCRHMLGPRYGLRSHTPLSNPLTNVSLPVCAGRDLGFLQRMLPLTFSQITQRYFRPRRIDEATQGPIEIAQEPGSAAVGYKGGSIGRESISWRDGKPMPLCLCGNGGRKL